MNNNDNTLGSPQSHTVGFTISSIAVGDFDNNNFNDIIIGGSSTVKIFPNTNGTINWTSPLWTVSVSLSSPIVLVGDMGTPTDPNRIDGWVDVVVSGYEAPVKIFANTQGAFSSTPQQSFQSGLPYSGVGKMTLADIQNTGGLSFVYTHSSTPIGQPTTMMIRTNKHTGNPAPAPPKGVAVAATPPDPYGYRYPKVTWAPNGERDINGYDVWRRIVSATDCGNGVWYYLASVNGSTWEYTDGSIGTAGLGNQCTAEYKVLAKDAANNLSDFSAVVQIEYSNLWFKRSEEGGGKLVARVPSRHELHAAYPNPFNPSTEIKFDLPEDAHVTLAVYDMLGRKVADLVSDNYAAGYHSATWNANEIASGVYFARFTASDVNGTLKLSKSSKLILNK
jgi:hypothetical protein